MRSRPSRRLGGALLAATLVVPGAWGQEPAPPPPPPQQQQQAGNEQSSRAPMPPPEFLPHCLRLIRQKQYEQARSLLDPVVVDHPGWARAHFYLALTYHKQNRYARARSLYARTLEIDPEYHTVRPFYGWSLYYLGELDSAREMFESFLAVRPQYPDAIFALGLIAFDNDDVDSARKHFTTAIRLSSEKQDRGTEAKSRARLADVHLRSGELELARDELRLSIESNPDNYETYFKLSRVLERLGDAAGAAEARARHREVRERVRPGTGGPPREGS